MPFSGDQKHVAVADIGHGGGNGRAAVGNFDSIRAGFEDIASDHRRILGTRIVVGDPDQVGMFMRHLSHQGAFAGVALAAGAEDKGKASACLGTKRLQHRFKPSGVCA